MYLPQPPAVPAIIQPATPPGRPSGGMASSTAGMVWAPVSWDGTMLRNCYRGRHQGERERVGYYGSRGGGKRRRR